MLSRWLIRLVALALVPVLVVTSGDGARASTPTSAGPAFNTQVDTGGGRWSAIDPDAVVCNLSYRWITAAGVGPGTTAPTSYVSWKANCQTSWNVAKADAYFSWRGLSSVGAGGGCKTDSAWNQIDGHPVQSGYSEALTGTVVGGIPRAADCSISEVCMVVTIDFHSWGGGTDTDCFDVAMGAPPDPPDVSAPVGTCPHGTVAQPFRAGPKDSKTWDEGAEPPVRSPVHVDLSDPNAYGPKWGIDWRAPWTAGVTNPSGGGQWYFYVVTDAAWNAGMYGATYGNWDVANQREYGLAGVNVSLTAGVASETVYVPYSRYIGGYPYHGQVPNPQYNVIGVGYYWSTNGRQDYGTYPGRTGPIGMSNAGACQFYWGQKIAETPNDTTDDPLGAVDDTDPGPPDDGGVTDPPPASNGDDCGFNILDPTTYASAGICELVRVLKEVGGAIVSAINGLAGVIGAAIAGALSGIASAIASAVASALGGLLGSLGDLIQTLFVPDQDHLQQKIQSVKDAWSQSPPGVLLTDVTGIPAAMVPPAGSSDCNGPGFSLDFAGMGSGGDIHPLSTCSPAVAQVTRVGYVAMQVGIWVTVLLLSFRILASSMGYQIAKGDGEDS